MKINLRQANLTSAQRMKILKRDFAIFVFVTGVGISANMILDAYKTPRVAKLDKRMYDAKNYVRDFYWSENRIRELEDSINKANTQVLGLERLEKRTIAWEKIVNKIKAVKK